MVSASLAPVRIGLLGLGTVGGGTVTVLRRNAGEIMRRAGRSIELVAACDKDPSRQREFGLEGITFTDDPFAVVNDPAVDIIVELIGGIEPARELVVQALANGKHVVTANKALIATHGNAIFGAAHEHSAIVAFEAAVAGGIPIIKATREGLAGNKLEWLAGIINGTCNFILSAMSDEGRDFDAVLADAQRLGYAEADPSFDIDGIDAAHKLTIMAAIAFGIPLQFDKIYIEGIRETSVEDLNYARQLGYAVKHLGIARRTGHGIELRVHPALVPERHLLANVNGVMNAVMITGDAVGPTLFCGAGAGAEPTASAIVADLIDVVRALTTDPENRVPHLAFQPDALADLPIAAMDDTETAYYLRMRALDQPGVLADVTRILGDLGISIEAIRQQEPGPDESTVPVIILTHCVRERAVNDAIAQIEALDAVFGQIKKIRMESLT